jgi:hypothetical protein
MGMCLICYVFHFGSIIDMKQDTPNGVEWTKSNGIDATVFGLERETPDNFYKGYGEYSGHTWER